MSGNQGEFHAIATTAAAVPGSETPNDDGTVSVAGQAFEDIVESDDVRLAGNNSLLINMRFNPADGSGSLEGTFVLKPNAHDGEWRGHMTGEMAGGVITSKGTAEGTGALAGAELEVEFRQVTEHPTTAPIENPIAIFEMTCRLRKR